MHIVKNLLLTFLFLSAILLCAFGVLMTFRFDINKSIAATAFLIQQAGGRCNIFPIVKTLYYANRISLVEYGRPITGDRLISMDKGPAVSETYDLLKASPSANEENLKQWQQFISRRTGNAVWVVRAPNLDVLSEREKETLARAWLVVKNVKGTLSEWSHNVFPEWKPTSGSSKTIDPREILKLEKKTEDEISEIESEISAVNWIRSIA